MSIARILAQARRVSRESSVFPGYLRDFPSVAGLLQSNYTRGNRLKDIQILVADDNKFVRRAIRSVLQMETDFEIICEAANGVEAVEESAKLQPAVVLMDVSMPGIGGLEAARQILEGSPNTEIILLTEHAVAEMAHTALSMGIRGYVIKSDAAKDLPDAIRTVIQKKKYVSSGLPAHPNKATAI
jgi:DNA-binding NarL/FixJ family response regulator